MNRLRVTGVLLLLVASILVAIAAPTHAAIFSNSASITLNDPDCTDPDAATPYPSTISVSGLTGTLSDVNVTLHGVTHAFQGDIEALLVGPSGENLTLISDAGTGSLSNADVTFDDAAATALPQNTAWAAGTYKPTNYTEITGADTFPAPAPAVSAATTLATFNGTNPNGTWSLYVTDDACSDAGSFSGGWSLDITAAANAITTTSIVSSPNPSTTGGNVTFTATVTSGATPVTEGTVTFTEGATTLAANVPVDGAGQATYETASLVEGNHVVTATYNGTVSFATSNDSVDQRVDNATVQTGSTYCNPGAITAPVTAGAAFPYPSSIAVSGASTSLGALTVQLKNVTHAFPEDLDVLLVGPTGQNLVLVSDAGNGSSPASNITVTLDDAAVADLPAASWGTPGTSVDFRPKDYDPAAEIDTFAAPAPAPSTATALSAFAGTNANGAWRLYVVDDGAPDGGTIAGGWCVAFADPPQADVSVTKTDAPDPVVAGSNITYTITVTNPTVGSTAATVQLTDPIPAFTTFVSLAAPSGWTCSPQAVGSADPLSCTRAALTPADGDQVFSLVVKVKLQTPSATPITNIATVSATGDDLGTGNNVAVSSTSVTFAASRPAVVRSSVNWLLRNTLTSGGADVGPFVYGTKPNVPVFGDWDGNGTKTPGSFEGGIFKLNNANDNSAPDLIFSFGDSRAFPVSGDFDGNGVDDVALFRDGIWHIRHLGPGAPPDKTFAFGPVQSWPRVVPVAGDWNGDGTDGVGYYNLMAPAAPLGQWTLRQTASAIASDTTVTYGGSGLYPVVGDWNGDGVDTLGTKQTAGTSWQLSNTNVAPVTSISFTFGQANTDLPFAWR